MKVLAASLATLMLAALAPATSIAAEPANATQLARIMMPKETWSRGINELGQMMQSRMSAHPGASLQYPPDFKDKVRAELEKTLPYDDLVAMHAKELAAAYSPQELDGLVAFYGGPLGKKALDTGPQVSAKVAQAAQARVEGKMSEMMKRLSEHAKKPEGGAGAGPHGGAPHGAKKPDAAPAKKAPPAKTDAAKKAPPAAAKPAETAKPADGGTAAPAPATPPAPAK